ncbi:damage-control phosphatase [Physcia stellaris]|nr:damage-control phosphatase [Physcia stellaris]
MDQDTKTPPYVTSDKTSFAYTSARTRWPVIVTGAIDDLHRTIVACDDEEKRQEGKTLVEGLAKLKYELQHDRQLTPLPDDGQPDIEGYNKELESLGAVKWSSVPWLYAECYLYRRISTLFTPSHFWKSYDVFARQKMATFRSSRPAVLELAAKYEELVLQLEKDKIGSKTAEELEEAEKILFMEMLEICLWGNATDLSLLTSLTYEDIQKLQGSKARKEAEKNILVNDLPATYQILKQAQKTKGNEARQVDIVLDNAGFELFVDLILAGYLLSAGLATCIVLHPKSIPWFVSDVLPRDFGALLNALADPQTFYSSPSDEESQAGRKPEPLSESEVSNLHFLFQSWSGFHQEGQLSLRPNRFWTHAGSYWRLPHTETRLYQDLKESELVVFKGDLNYRKLTGDAMWDLTTPFTTAIGPLGPGSGVRVLALRTCKADVVVGLTVGITDDLQERLRATDDGVDNSGARKWAWSGKWAVIQFSDGKS